MQKRRSDKVVTYVLEVKAEAQFEIIEAFNYYEERRIGLGDEFLDHLENYFNRITVNPWHFFLKSGPLMGGFYKAFSFFDDL